MAIDNLNSLSTEQMLAMQLQSNGQLTSSESSSNITESDIAFESVMQNYINNAFTNTNNSNSTGIPTEQLLALSLMSNGQLTASDDDSSAARDMSNQMQYASTLAFQQIQKSLNDKQSSAGSANESKVIEQSCPTGQDLQQLTLKVNGSPIGRSNFSASNVPAADMEKIEKAVKQASKKYGVDERLIMAIIKQESNFNSNAVSSAGAMGLMQVMPANFSSVGITDPYDVTQNVNGGTQIIKQCLNQYNGDISMALMAYNGGSGNMLRRGVTSANDLYKMPQETQNYVPSVLNYYRNGIN